MTRPNPKLTSPQSLTNNESRARFSFRPFLLAAAATLLVVTVAFGAWLSYAFWETQSYHAHLDALTGEVLSWKTRCPPDVPQLSWDDACQMVQIAVVNVVFRPRVSLGELRRLRAEVDNRGREQITVETFEWLLNRLAQTGPEGAEYIHRMEPLWNEPLDRLRRRAEHRTTEKDGTQPAPPPQP